MSEEWRLSGSSEIGEKCVRKTKGKKKKKKKGRLYNKSLKSSPKKKKDLGRV